MADSVSRLYGQLRMGVDGGIGAQRIALLEAIAQHGSISAGARAVNLSYKAAWDAVHVMNNLAETPLVERAVGGSGGGGSRLSDAGQRLVRTYRAAEEEQARFLANLNRRVQHLPGDIDLMGRLAMMTSARNQLLGTVHALALGAVNAEVEIALRGGDRLTAVITRSSAENLGLEEGIAVTALIKASWVIVAVGDGSGLAVSARNRLTGTVDAITRDTVSSEIVLRLPGGATLAAVVTRDSADRLALATGDTATAMFKASSVILAGAD